MVDELWSKVTAFVENAMKETNVPGCSVGILHHGEIKSAGFGVASTEKMDPVGENTLFQIGSISKTFTAMVSLKLVEDGKLDLDKPVRTYLPDFQVADEAVSAAVTLRHLLTHTAGWDGDLFIETGDGDDAIEKYILRMAERKQIFALGKYFSYNNSGFAVLGAILEKVSQMKLEELYRNYIIDPLELKQVFFNAGEVITYDFAVGHHSSPEGNQVARPWRLSRNILPMGGIITTTADLLRYAECYLAQGKTPDGRQILKPETILAMFTPKMTINSEDHTSVGYSWMRRDLHNSYIINHGGGTKGQITQLSMLPEHNFALAIFTNSDDGGKLIPRIQSFLLKTYLNVEYALPKVIESTPGQLSGYTGVAYRPGMKIYLEMMGDHLVGLSEYTIGFPTEKDPPPPPEPPFRVGRCAEDRLIILDGDGKDIPVDIFRDADGNIIHMRSGRMFNFNPNLKT